LTHSAAVDDVNNALPASATRTPSRHRGRRRRRADGGSRRSLADESRPGRRAKCSAKFEARTSRRVGAMGGAARKLVKCRVPADVRPGISRKIAQGVAHSAAGA